MAFAFLSPPHLLTPQTHFLSLKRPHTFLKPRPHAHSSLSLPPPLAPTASSTPTPPIEALEDSSHGVSKFQQIEHQASRTRKLQEDFKKHQSTFLSAIADVDDRQEKPRSIYDEDQGGDLFGEIVKAIALKRKEFTKQGLLKPTPKKEEVEDISELGGR